MPELPLIKQRLGGLDPPEAGVGIGNHATDLVEGLGGDLDGAAISAYPSKVVRQQRSVCRQNQKPVSQGRASPLGIIFFAPKRLRDPTACQQVDPAALTAAQERHDIVIGTLRGQCLNGTHHSPFLRGRGHNADATGDPALAIGGVDFALHIKLGTAQQQISRGGYPRNAAVTKEATPDLHAGIFQPQPNLRAIRRDGQRGQAADIQQTFSHRHHHFVPIWCRRCTDDRTGAGRRFQHWGCQRGRAGQSCRRIKRRRSRRCGGG